jgi:hypothetical protein
MKTKMEKGMIFDLYQEGQTTKRVMAVNETDVLVLEDQTFIFNIDYDNESEGVLIDNIFAYDRCRCRKMW